MRGIRVPGGATLSRKQVDEIEAEAKKAGALGLLRLKCVNGALEGPSAKFLAEGAAARLGLAGRRSRRCSSRAPTACRARRSDRVRQDVARRMNIVSGRRDTRFLWVTDFPMFEKDAATGALGAVHHPFTAPHAGGRRAARHRAGTRARAGVRPACSTARSSAAGASASAIPACSRAIFGLLGIDEATAQARFGFLLEGLRAGAPPHGGIAFGFDRIAMLLAERRHRCAT